MPTQLAFTSNKPPQKGQVNCMAGKAGYKLTGLRSEVWNVEIGI
jgi:hypothetical protein